MPEPASVMRVGRIAYRNVLPLYYPLEQGLISNRMRFVYGPPAELNRRMQAGQLDVASISSIEYARRPAEYLLLPDLAIGSFGPVQSVLLLSSLPVERLAGQRILVSSETHTSAMLLRLLLEEYWGVPAVLEAGVGPARTMLQKGERPVAVLAIGDEALLLRANADFGYHLDLGEVWREWTGMPFVFGVWAMRRSWAEANPAAASEACALFMEAKRWARENMEALLPLAGMGLGLDFAVLRRYFKGLSYDLGPAEQRGLSSFFLALQGAGLLEQAPQLGFFQHTCTLDRSRSHV